MVRQVIYSIGLGSYKHPPCQTYNISTKTIDARMKVPKSAAKLCCIYMPNSSYLNDARERVDGGGDYYIDMFIYRKIYPP